MFLLKLGDNSLWQKINEWDTWLFLKINTECTNSFFDNALPVWRDANTWLPLYLFLLTFTFLNFGWRGWPYIVFIAITITISDQISSNFLKDWINRPRPCNDESVKYAMRLLLNRCPSSGSFTSSHATNHFAAAVFFYCTLRPYFKKFIYLFFFWAGSIAYAQVYIGVHYPADVIGGAILGSLIGFTMAFIFKNYIRFPSINRDHANQHNI